MKFFLTGASGILGTDIAGLIKASGHDLVEFNSSNIIINDYHDVLAKVEGFAPDVVIHCAALTNVDLCEDDKELAYQINVNGSENMARASAQVGAKIVYISSCGVYGNGETEPYTEQSDTNPTTYHHYTKLKGEEAVKENCTKHLIIRPGWLFGGTILHKKNFVEARRKEAEKTDVLKSAEDKFGSPTYTADLAKQIMLLITNNVTGTFNAVNEGCASRYEYVAEIVRLFNFQAKVEPVNSNLFPRKANMPDNECLLNYNLGQQKINEMRHWKEALKDYITTTYKI